VDETGRRLALEPGAALPGERVLVEPVAEGRGEVASAVGGTRREWIGILGKRGREPVLTPYRDDAEWEIRLARASLRGARPGDVVVAVFPPAPPRTGGKRARGPAVARVVEVLGPPGTPESDFRAIAWRHRLPREFPRAALAEAEAVPAALDAAECARRRDLRELPFVTIDPATARDHDDAVCVEDLAGGRVRLWVAIADVSWFVAEDRDLDREARRRGNSVYFPDRAIPMLPERLSGELCSLRPDVDRLVLAVEMEIDASGAVAAARFHEAVMRSRARLVYDDAAVVMEGGRSARVAPGPVTEQLRRLAAVAERLTARRRAAGSIELDLPSAEIVLGDASQPTDIREAPRTIAHRAIEEAMLAANRCVAERLLANGVPTLYRVHEPPTPSSLVELRALLESFGLLAGVRGGAFGAGEIADAVARAAGRPEERLVNTAALRSMRPARYDPRCLGHFALAFDAYLHFTSPIRRYADLVVHRGLRDHVTGGKAARDRSAARAPRVAAWAERASLCERTGMAAEREAVDLAKCVFMRDRVGEHFDATISRVAKHGFYATLDPFFVDCLVPLRTLPGRFELDDRGAALVTRRGGARFALGDRVRIVVTQVDLQRGWIDGALEGVRDAPSPSRRPRAQRGPQRRRGRAGRR
jgi:ribonuclease R